MKAKLYFKIIFLFILCAFASATAAQEKKPKAILFDEISDAEAEYSVTFDEKLEKLKKRLAKEPDTTKAYIDEPQNSALGEKIKLSVEKDAASAKRVMFWGKLKHPDLRRGVELGWEIGIYLIPQGAEIPSHCILEAYECPNLSIIAPENTDNRNSILTFTVKVESSEPDIKYVKYQWTVTAGKIIEGQGTKTIRVDATGAKEITAKLEINGGGLYPECSNTAEFTTKIQ